MSWQNFVDESLLGTSQVSKASIHGLNGARYACSRGFVVSCVSTTTLLSTSVLLCCAVTTKISRFSVLSAADLDDHVFKLNDAPLCGTSTATVSGILFCRNLKYL